MTVKSGHRVTVQKHFNAGNAWPALTPNMTKQVTMTCFLIWLSLSYRAKIEEAMNVT